MAHWFTDRRRLISAIYQGAVPADGAVVGTSCCGCRRVIARGQLVTDRKILERDGTLDYIELWHVSCDIDDQVSRALGCQPGGAL